MYRHDSKSRQPTNPIKRTRCGLPTPLSVMESQSRAFTFAVHLTVIVHTRATVAVRAKFPDWSNSLKVVVPVQSGFTVYVPESMVFVTLPFKLAVTGPLTFPCRVQCQ